MACKLLVAACMWDLVPVLGARSLIHCATREVPKGKYFKEYCYTGEKEESKSISQKNGQSVKLNVVSLLKNPLY